MGNSNDKRLPDESELNAMASDLIAGVEGFVGAVARRGAGGLAPAAPSSDDGGMPGADGMTGDNALDGEVIPAPASSDDVVARAPRVIEHRTAGDPLRVLPGWVTSADVFVPAFRRHARFVASWVGYHGLRSPVYLARFLGRAAVGLGVCTARLARWVLDSEHKATRKSLVEGVRGTAEYRALRKEYRESVRARLAGVVAAGTLTGVAGVTTYSAAGQDGFTLAAGLVGAGAVTAFGIVGTKKVATPIADVQDTKVPPLTVDVVQEALLTLGLGSMGEAKRGLAEIKVLRIFPAAGGVEIHIDLPPGATAADVVERKERLAAALRRPVDCVWPEGNPEAHPSRLNLYIADRALSKRGQVLWKYRNKGGVNVFEPFEIGEDQRGRPVTVNLMYNNGVIGGLPGMGKTFFLRVLILGAMLDARTELHVHELKGTGDLLPLAPVAHVCRSGDDPEDLAALLADLKAVHGEMRRRAKVIRGLPRDVCPESKVTDQLAQPGNPHGFKPLLFVIDESQLAFTDASLGAEITALTEDITRRGRALGIMLWLATQRPSKAAIPTGISALLSLRAALRVGDQTTNDMVLGTSMYKAGHRATMFSQEDRGIVLLAGEKSDPQLVRGAFIDGHGADKIVERARAEREARGLLTGMAAGDQPDDVDHSTILDHLLEVWPAEDPQWPNGKVWSEELATRLAASRPALYEGWDAAQVNAAAKRHGVNSKSVKHGTGARNVRTGLERAHIVAALGDDTPPTHNEISED